MENLKEIEKALVGSFILEKDSFDELYPIVKGIELEGANGIVFKAVEELANDNKPIDFLTVTQRLMAKGELEKIGGAGYLTDITTNVNQSVGEYHAFLLKERQIKHQIFAIGSKIMSGIEQKRDVLELLAELQEDLEQARSGLARVKVSDAREAVTEYQKEREEVLTSGGDLIGATTGINCVDRRLKGYRKGKLYIIAARPGMGKSAKMCFNALASASNGKPVVIYSYEMGKAELVGRMLATLTGLDSEKIANHEYAGTGYEQQLSEAEDLLSTLPIFIEEAGGMSALDIKAVTQRIDIECQKRFNTPLHTVFVDYIQLMSTPLSKNTNREQEVSANSRELKLLSKKYAVVALSQLSRAVEQTADKRPMLSHLRESGSIEQDADCVMFLFRPEVYGIMEDEAGNSLSGLCEVIIRKLRGGKIGTELTLLSLSKMHFQDFEFEQVF